MDMIKAEKVFKSFDKTNKVLRGIDFKISMPGVFLITGPNGSGKTTFLKILANLIIQDSGSVEILGYRYVKDAPKIKSFLSLCFEPDRDFYQMLKVYDNIKVFLKLKNSFNKRILDKAGSLFKELGIEEYKNKSFNHCSAGIRRKISVLRAILTDYKVIMIDEPAKSLDDISRKRILSMIKKDAEDKGAVCIITSSSPCGILPFADKKFVIENGVLKEITNDKPV